jgi:hypothetical protein
MILIICGMRYAMHAQIGDRLRCHHDKMLTKVEIFDYIH